MLETSVCKIMTQMLTLNSKISSSEFLYLKTRLASELRSFKSHTNFFERKLQQFLNDSKSASLRTISRFDLKETSKRWTTEFIL